MNGQRSTLKGMAALEIQSAGYGAENATVSGRRRQHGDQVRIQQVRARPQRLRRGQPAQLLPRQPGLEGAVLLLRAQPEHLGSDHQGQALVLLQLRGASRAGWSTRPTRWVWRPETADYNYFSLRGSGKLTWQINPRNKLVNFTNFNSRSNFNNVRGYDPYAEPEAQTRQDDRDIFTGLIWESLAHRQRLPEEPGRRISVSSSRLAPQMCQTDPIACRPHSA